MKTILLTNDDGFYSKGILFLKSVLAKKYRVFVIAPDRERSAVSMSLTLHQPLRINQVEEGVFAVNGTTSDCVNIALQKILPQPPDFVVSGMNLGENLSEDIFFSGTVGGAFSGFLYGIPSLAVSLVGNPGMDRSREFDFAEGAEVAERVISRLLRYRHEGVVYNLNIPFPNNGKIRVTSLGSKRYKPDIIERVDPRGGKYYWIGTGSPDYSGKKGTDVWAVQMGYISLSVISYDFNSLVQRRRLSREFVRF
jgi:5'-nucleotidase